MRISILIGISLTLAGCIPVRIDTPPQSVQLTSKGRATPANKVQTYSLRTFLNVGKNRIWIEDVVGVSCKIRSANYTANVTSPAAIVLPTWGTETPPVEVTCEYNGEVVVDRGGGCFFHTGDSPDPEADDPRGICSHADFSIIFGK